MTLEEARARAEKLFKQEEHGSEGNATLAEYQADLTALRQKTARLKALRLAKEAQADKAVPGRKRRT
jgi:hypothetical protein